MVANLIGLLTDFMRGFNVFVSFLDYKVGNFSILGLFSVGGLLFLLTLCIGKFIIS